MCTHEAMLPGDMMAQKVKYWKKQDIYAYLHSCIPTVLFTNLKPQNPGIPEFYVVRNC